MRVRDAGGLDGNLDSSGDVVGEEQADGQDAHQAAVAAVGVLVESSFDAGLGFLDGFLVFGLVGGLALGAVLGVDEDGALPGEEGIAGCDADVEAVAGRGHVADAVPGEVAAGLVDGGAAGEGLEEGVGQAERHGGIVGELARGQSEVVVGKHARDKGEAAAGFELDRAAESVAYGKAEEGAADARLC